MKRIIFSSAVLLTANFAIAAEQVPSVVVSAARTEQSTVTTPASITIITQKDIQASGAEHIVDVLRGYGGVYAVDTFGDGSRAAISMRGFSSSNANANTLILVDGRRLNNADISNPDLNSISLKDVERIEIVQGSAGVLYGDQAVGGVINVITKKTKGEEGLLEASAGSYNSAGMRAIYGNSLDNGVNYRVSAEVRQSDNYRRENNAVNYANLLAKTEYSYANGTISTELQHVKEDLQLPGSLLASEMATDRRQTYVDFLNDFTNSDTNVVRIGSTHNINDALSFEGEATYRDMTRDIQQSFRGFVATSSSRLEQKQTELTPRLVAVLPLANGDMQLTAGLDMIATDYNSELTTTADKQNMLAEYVQAVVPLQKNLKVTVGFRHASVEDDLASSFVNGKQDESVNVAELGVSYDVSEHVRLFGRLDQNFRFAKVDEQTYVSPGTQLKPQTGDSLEAGINYHDQKLNSKLVLYKLTLKDEIAFDPSAPDPFGGNFGANVNFDPTTHQGVILESRYLLTADMNVSASYTYTDAKFDSGVFANNDISGVPTNSGRVHFDYQLTDTTGVNLGAVYIGSHYLDGDNSNSQSKVDAYTVMDANLRYTTGDWKLALKINNITDRKYFENANSFGSRFPLPERNILLTAGWQFI